MSNCKARQYSDQMQCVCGLAWDVNDPEPPECKGTPGPTGPKFIDVDERLSWPDDEGQYLRNCPCCGGTFAGGKGRLWCRVCAPSKASEPVTDVNKAHNIRRDLDRLKTALEGDAHMPDVLFDGYAVYQALGPKAQARTSPENVSDVLDAVVNLLRG